MRIRTALLIAAGLVVTVLVVGAVVLLNLDFNAFKEQIAAEAKKATGRELVIKGDLKLDLFTLSPGLAVEDVNFANAPWGSRKEMARIERFEVKVAILPLLSGALEVQRVVLSGADVLIERDKQGRGNYEFKPADSAKSDGKSKTPEAPAKTVEKKAAGLPTLTLREVSINDAKVTYRDAASGQKLILQLDDMTVRGGTRDPLEIELKGSYNAAPIKANGRVGALAALVAPGETPWPVALTVEAGGATIDLKGSVKAPAEASGLDLRVSVKGKDLSAMTPLTGAPVPPLGPYSVVVRVLGSPERSINLRDLVAKVGESGVRGRADLTLKGKPRLTAALSADRIDLADFMKAPPEKAAGGGTAKTQSSAGEKSRGNGDGRVFPADPLALDGLKAADATVDMTVKKLLAQGMAVENLEARVNLRNGNLKLAPFGADVSNGKVNGNVELDAGKRVPKLALALKGTKIDIGKLLKDLKVTDVVEGAINAEVDVNGTGRSVRQIMAGLNGRTRVLMGKGRMKSNALDMYVGGAATVATQALFGKKSEYTVINCFVNQFDVRNGLATSKVMLFDTDYATIRGNGTINLADERIKYEVDPRPKSTTVTTAVPVKVGGTLAKPSFRLDPLATAAKVGGLLGIAIFPPAAVAGLGDLGTGEDNPCLDMLKTGGQTKGTTAQPAPKKTIPKAEDVGKDVKETIEKGLKNLFGR